MALTKIKETGIADDAVTAGKIAAGAVVADITTGSVTATHLAGSIPLSKTNFTAGNGISLATDTVSVSSTLGHVTGVGTLTGLTVATDNENIARFDGLQGNIDFRYGSDIEFDRAGQVYITANNGSGELNFRTGGQNIAMHIDSSQKVGIGGITSPDSTLHVHTATAGSVTANAYADELVLENNDHGGLSILTPADKVGIIYFGDPGANNAGQIFYDHDNTRLGFAVENSNKLFVNADGDATLTGDLTLGGDTQLETAYTNLQLYMPGNATGLVLANGASPSDARNWGIYTNYSHWGALDFRVSSARDAVAHTTEVLSLKKDGSAILSANASGAYGLFVNNSNSGGYGLRIAGGASSADYLIRGQNEGGTDKFVVKSDGSVTAEGNIASENFSSETAFGGDVDTLKRAGFYRIENSASNMITGNYYSMIVAGNGSNVTSQWAVDLLGGQTYTRSFNTSWTSWARIDD